MGAPLEPSSSPSSAPGLSPLGSPSILRYVDAQDRGYIGVWAVGARRRGGDGKGRVRKLITAGGDFIRAGAVGT